MRTMSNCIGTLQRVLQQEHSAPQQQTDPLSSAPLRFDQSQPIAQAKVRQNEVRRACLYAWRATELCRMALERLTCTRISLAGEKHLFE